MTAKTTKQGAKQDSAMNAAESIAAASQETMRNFAKASTESYEKAFGGMRDKAEKMFEGYGDMAASGKQSMEAWNNAGAAYGRGMEAISGEWMKFAKQMLDSNVQATKAILGAKSLNEAMELQSEYARGSFDGFMAQSTKVGEMATKVAQETAEPINAQFTASVEKWRQNAA
ncbi:MAG: phasin family protein [Alphaproteobacteria bacterium]|jgi:phasin family protein|nr:phasin family protein [Alphaproteobacteria bacterium]MDP6833437.1 phasin family protein [Alphaproteobacteria bacterium]